ncbi:MAG: hypothetical protein HY040_20860 [Planctomycetes bacterium]|nr:hypothetical protein [Planctomycetota bacterium]
MLSNIIIFKLLGPERLSDKKHQRWEMDHYTLLKPIGAKLKYYDTIVEATPENVAQLLKLLEEWKNEGARINGYEYAEKLVDDEHTPVEWFIVEPSGNDYDAIRNWWRHLERSIESLDDYLSVRADQVKGGIHVAGSPWEIYVSERFKSVVQSHRLTGIDFVWIRDIGKYQAMQWYFPVCSHTLGRGLDHPWLDIGKLSVKSGAKLDSRGRHGECTILPRQCRLDAGPDPDIRKLLSLMRSMELLKRPPRFFDAVPRFLRRHLPETDFAFTVLDTQEKRILNRVRGLSMNRKARDLLKANGLVTDEQCMPVLIVERAPRGVQNLDRLYGKPAPAFSPDQLVRVRELEAQAWGEHVANPKPRRTPDLARALTLLRTAKRYAPKKYTKPASPKTITEAERTIGTSIPLSWKHVLRISNGGHVDNCSLAGGYACRMIPVELLAKERQAELVYYRQIGAELSDGAIVVMTTEFGDSVWLDTSRPSGRDDCRVTLMSHESGVEQREWSSVAEFLEEVFTANVQE